MGWWKLLANVSNAEGIREATRMSYKKHLALGSSGQGPADGTPAHYVGLYGALASRLQLQGGGAPEVVIWGELAPFVAMPQDAAIDALAEYVVAQEKPAEARTAWLRAEVNRAIRGVTDHQTLGMAHMGIVNGAPWTRLLDADVQATLTRRIAGTP